MKLDNPITINVGSGDPLILNELDVIVFDHESRKLVLAKLHPAATPLPLWRGKEYDEIGDYTQAQINERILELLGEDIQHGVQSLFAQPL